VFTVIILWTPGKVSNIVKNKRIVPRACRRRGSYEGQSEGGQKAASEQVVVTSYSARLEKEYRNSKLEIAMNP